jgi:hypothetical protein
MINCLTLFGNYGTHHFLSELTDGKTLFTALRLANNSACIILIDRQRALNLIKNKYFFLADKRIDRTREEK